MIGNSAVGKSSVLTKYVDNAFDVNLINTIGIDFRGKTVEIADKTVQLHIWDTAGQERFWSVTPAYCRKADGIVLMYDITKMTSFRGISFWFDKIRQYAPTNVEILVLGNKRDMEKNREVSQEMGAEAARRIGAPFFEVSAMTGYNIEEAFVKLTKVILGKRDFFADSAVYGDSSTAANTSDGVIDIEKDHSKSLKDTCCNQSTMNK